MDVFKLFVLFIWMVFCLRFTLFCLTLFICVGMKTGACWWDGLLMVIWI